jgi:hypothetical protein|tara:strand:- start:1544 stop:2263 length:720 start_codon:yes stop_codon:yes gene_type:complete
VSNPGSENQWEVLPHGAVERLEENLWRVEGTIKGMGLKRVMTLAKLADGQLVIHNGIALDQESMNEIENWGTPAILIVPNGFHRLDAAAYLERYPALRVFCPKGARSRVEEVVRVKGDYEDYDAEGPVTLDHLAGVAEAEGVMKVLSNSGTTLVFNDAIFNMAHGEGVVGFIFRHVTQSTGGPRVSRLTRWLMVKDAAALRTDLERLANTENLKRIIVSHHETIVDEPADILRQVASRL